MVTLIARADLALSVVMTTVSTLAAVLLTPLSVSCTGPPWQQAEGGSTAQGRSALRLRAALRTPAGRGER